METNCNTTVVRWQGHEAGRHLGYLRGVNRSICVNRFEQAPGWRDKTHLTSDAQKLGEYCQRLAYACLPWESQQSVLWWRKWIAHPCSSKLIDRNRFGKRIERNRVESKIEQHYCQYVAVAAGVEIVTAGPQGGLDGDVTNWRLTYIMAGRLHRRYLESIPWKSWCCGEWCAKSIICVFLICVFLYRSWVMLNNSYAEH